MGVCADGMPWLMAGGRKIGGKGWELNQVVQHLILCT